MVMIVSIMSSRISFGFIHWRIWPHIRKVEYSLLFLCISLCFAGWVYFVGVGAVHVIVIN